MVAENVEIRMNKKSKINGKKDNDTLFGMKSICDYVHRTEPTVLSYIKTAGFPAKKVGGIWETRRDLINSWRKSLS